MTVLLPHGASVLRSEEPGEALSLSWNKGISREAPGRPAVADAVSCGKAAGESSFRWAGSCRTCAVEGKRRRSSTERTGRSEEHTSELQSRENLVCRLLLEKKKHLND